jgi:hypothetical protein
MGGICSTRWGGHPRRRTIGEGTYAIRAGHVAEVARELFAAYPDLLPRVADGAWHWRSGLAVEWTLSAPDARGTDSLTLWHLGGRALSAGYLVRLERVRQPLAGIRWWLRCPSCRARRAALYLTPATATRLAFRCRACLGLAYATQRREPRDRLLLKLQGLARHMGNPAPDGLPGLPPRPRGMRRRTYERLAARFRETRAARDALFIACQSPSETGSAPILVMTIS